MYYVTDKNGEHIEAKPRYIPPGLRKTPQNHDPEFDKMLRPTIAGQVTKQVIETNKPAIRPEYYVDIRNNPLGLSINDIGIQRSYADSFPLVDNVHEEK
jgi:hypothetical protein